MTDIESSLGHVDVHVAPEEAMLKLALAGKAHACRMFEFANKTYGMNFTEAELAQCISNEEHVA